MQLDKAIKKAIKALKKRYDELAESGIPVIIIFVKRDGSIEEVRIGAYAHGDIIDEYDIDE